VSEFTVGHVCVSHADGRRLICDLLLLLLLRCDCIIPIHKR